MVNMKMLQTLTHCDIVVTMSRWSCCAYYDTIVIIHMLYATSHPGIIVMMNMLCKLWCGNHNEHVPPSSHCGIIVTVDLLCSLWHISNGEHEHVANIDTSWHSSHDVMLIMLCYGIIVIIHMLYASSHPGIVVMMNMLCKLWCGNHNEHVAPSSHCDI
jgi:hypothetical protein